MNVVIHVLMMFELSDHTKEISFVIFFSNEVFGKENLFTEISIKKGVSFSNG